MLGISEIIIFLLIILFVFYIISLVKNRGVVHLSLSKFMIDSENEDLVIIEGRKTGLIQWILVQMKLGNIYQIKIKRDHITYSEESAAGSILSLVPIHKVSSTTCGYKKPLGLLFLAVILLIFAFISLFSVGFVSFLICLVLAAIFVALYILLKNFFITIETIGSTRLGFSFKRSYIENVPIDVDKIRIAVALINDLVIRNK